MFAAKPGSNIIDDKHVLAAARGAKDISHGHGHLRAWRKNPFGYIRSNKCIAEQSDGDSGHMTLKGREHGHQRSFSSVIIQYSVSNQPSPASLPSSLNSSSTSSLVWSSSESDDVAPALRRSSSVSSEVENPIQELIAYCKKSQQLASVRKSANDVGFWFLSSVRSKIVTESEGLEPEVAGSGGGLELGTV